MIPNDDREGSYAVVFFTTVIQGLTMKPVYKAITKKKPA